MVRRLALTFCMCIGSMGLPTWASPEDSSHALAASRIGTDSELVEAVGDVALVYPFNDDEGLAEGGPELSISRTHGSKDSVAMIQFESSIHQSFEHHAVRKITFRTHASYCQSETDNEIPIFVAALYDPWSVERIRAGGHAIRANTMATMIMPDEPHSRWEEYILWPDIDPEEEAPEALVDKILEGGLLLHIYGWGTREILHANCVVGSTESGFAPQVIVEYGDCRGLGCAFMPSIMRSRNLTYVIQRDRHWTGLPGD